MRAREAAIGLAILVLIGLLVFGLFVHFTGAADFKRILKAVLKRG